MSHIPFHPAIGFGDLLPGSFAVPQNPVRDAGTPLVPSRKMMTGGRVPHIGDLLPGKFPVPQNPIRSAITQGHNLGSPAGSLAGLGCGGSCGGSCGGGVDTNGGGCGCSRRNGMGDLSSWLAADNGFGSVQLPNWVWIGGAFALAYFLPWSSWERKTYAKRSAQ